jgi:surface carbohydrate biosynthesis protein (TIGR04326 family)
MQTEIILTSKKNFKKINLNEFIENNSSFLKKKFLKIVETTGEKKIFKKKFKNFFIFNQHINLWDLSNFYEKNIFKEDYINDSLQYLAILKIIKNYKLKEITLDNIDLRVLKTLRKYNQDINFKILNKKKIDYKKNLKIFILGNWLTSVIYFLKNNISFNKKIIKINYNSSNLIISYFCHYKKNFDKSNFFVSDHWRGLEKIIKKNFFYLNIFIPSRRFHTYQILKKNTNNKIENLKEKNFLNNYFYLNNIIQIIFYSFIYSLKFFFLSLVLKNKKDSQTALFELSYHIQKRSFSGITCLENLKNYYALKKFFSLNPNIKKCLYLMENQSWEKILLKFCETNKILSYGYIHATMPFWHLNYYQSKSLNIKNHYLPDKIFTVSKINLNLLSKQSIIKKKLTLVEALRYGWLCNIKKDKNVNNLKKILVFGDYDKKLNDKLLEVIEKFLFQNKKFLFFFKPHPGNILKYNSLDSRLRIIYNLPNELNFRYYIFSNSTSASAEYTHLTNNIAIFKSNMDINLSPFKDIKKYKNNFFSNEIELLDIVNSLKIKKINNFFYINNNLVKWKKTLNENFQK